GAVALVAGGVVMLAGGRRALAGRDPAAEEEVDTAQGAEDTDGGDPAFLDVVLSTPPEEPDDEPERDEVAPRRALAVTSDASAGTETVPDADPDTEPAGGRRAIDLAAFHLDDPLALDAGVRPRRALQPVPDSAATIAPAEDDTSWSDWYESAQDTMRRGRRALPSDPDGD